jgi:uncharacterized protein
MPVTLTYPGIYIEELPSNTHTITAAPTSVTVFVGYTHPFKTRSFGLAIELFSFADFEREFGGLYASGVIDSSLAFAVNQFFLNGGSVAYVVGLQPKYIDTSTTPPTGQGAVEPPVFKLGGADGITFTGREPVDQVPLTVTVTNLLTSKVANDTADITISYGTQTETYRRVTLDKTDGQNFIDVRLGTDTRPVSSLVTVKPTNSATQLYTTFTAQLTPAPLAYDPAPNAGWTTFNAGDFGPVFEQDSDLDKVPIFNLLLVPGVTDNSVWSQVLAFCERKQAFAVLDPPRQAAADRSSSPLVTTIDQVVTSGTLPTSPNGALYFPYLKSTNPLTGKTTELPPSGFVAGIYARTDQNRGVWKAPAGLETTVLNTSGVVDRGRMTDMRQGVLNPLGVNCLRDFPGIGTVVFGARTLTTANTAFEQWRYVPVRRLALFIEQTLYRNLGWAVFEPNDDTLWVALRTTVDNFMLSLFQQGAFFGTTPSQAFQVKCDASTTTQTDIDNGIVNIIVAFRPLKPAEFVVIKIAQLAGQVQA